MNTISIWCERQTSSFTKAFKKRYVTFEIECRKLSYAEDDRKCPRDTIIVTNIVRVCQVMEVREHELLTLIIDGKRADGKEEHWTLRMPDRQSFDEWTEILWTACAYAGLMGPFNSGLPPVDPLTKLPFAQVPLEHLFTFALLERAVIYFFDTVTLFTPTVKKDHRSGRQRLVVGDKAVYVFDDKAAVLHCSRISSINYICYGSDANFFAISFQPPEADIVVKDFTNSNQLASVLNTLFYAATNQEVTVVPITVPTAEMLVESYQLRLSGSENYKLHLIPPTNKARLRQKIDAGCDGAFDNVTTEVNNFEETSKQQEINDGLLAGESNDPEGNEPLVMLLCKIGLHQYSSLLLSQHVDLDVLQCMDASDLMTFGIKNEEHCKKILDAVVNTDMGNLEKVDDDELSLVISPKPAAKATVAGDIVLSDDDDICLLDKPRTAVVLDDDFDDDLFSLLPAAPSAAKPPIVLDDDDL